MPDREKVINKVTAIVADMQEEVDEWKDYSDSELRGGLTCDCDWWYKTLQTLNDALALLKAQEPRVMTLEEVEEGKPYWLEMRRIASEYAICKLNDNGDSAFLDFAVQFGWKTLESDGYGKTWRCWTARPTDEQREAIPWLT